MKSDDNSAIKITSIERQLPRPEHCVTTVEDEEFVEAPGHNLRSQA